MVRIYSEQEFFVNVYLFCCYLMRAGLDGLYVLSLTGCSGHLTECQFVFVLTKPLPDKDRSNAIMSEGLFEGTFSL